MSLCLNISLSASVDEDTELLGLCVNSLHINCASFVLCRMCVNISYCLCFVGLPGYMETVPFHSEFVPLIYLEWSNGLNLARRGGTSLALVSQTDQWSSSGQTDHC